MPTEPTPDPNPHWRAFFEELFRLARKLDQIEAERAAQQPEDLK